MMRTRLRAPAGAAVVSDGPLERSAAGSAAFCNCNEGGSVERRWINTIRAFSGPDGAAAAFDPEGEAGAAGAAVAEVSASLVCSAWSVSPGMARGTSLRGGSAAIRGAANAMVPNTMENDVRNGEFIRVLAVA